ncbi:hypothetical protein C8R44DRAFT_813444 [Mycena epipterygia]|nr:hypothetical protein C8R44DRAFT_813444 [Mycena epipterygia]
MLSSSAEPVPYVREFHFPPFPPVPPGVKIIPFHAFQEYGTRVIGADRIERDGLGIATIPLPSSKKQNKKKKGAAKAPSNGTQPKLPWWEEWEATGEHLRIRGPYDPKLDHVDRFHQAAADFQKYYKINPSIQTLWDKFKNFSGLAEATSVKTSKEVNEDEEMSDEGSDGELQADESASVANQETSTSVKQSGGVATDTAAGDVPATTEDNGPIFLQDPARAVQLFLSSYMRAQGLIWNPRALVSAPHLLRFFIKFLIRNSVLPEHALALEQALVIIDTAGKEFPLMPKISEAIPDAFSAACTRHWGRKADGLYFPSDSDAEDENVPDSKRPKLHHEGSAVQDDNIEAVQDDSTTNPDSGVRPNADAMDTDPDTTANAGWGPSSGWSSSGGWGQSIADTDASMDSAPNNSWGSGDWGSSTWGTALPTDQTRADPTPIIIEDAEPPASLLTLLGPTAFTLTHAPGVVEWAVRRVKSLMPPLSEGPPTPADAGDPTANVGANAVEGADAVERVLEARMWRAVMAPWLDWDADSEMARPRLQRSSVGAVVASTDTNIGASANTKIASADTDTESHNQPKPHDMLHDDIVVLVEPAAAETLCVGIGLGGTWVQLARVQDGDGGLAEEKADGTSAEMEKTKENKNLTGEAQKGALRYWYMDELMTVLPSYHVV